MTLRYDSFLTPFASPALGRIDVSGLSDAGRMLEQRAQYDQNRQDRLEKEKRDYALEQSATEGRNRYFDAQAATHRMQIEQAKNADAEKRARSLFDAFRKAKTPNERRAITDELQRLGFQVEEQETEMPAESAAAPASPAQAPPVPGATAAPKPAKGKKPPKPNPKFAAALGQIVSEEGAQEAPVDEAALGPGSLSSVLGVPGVGGTAGEMGAASAKVDIPETSARGGRFLIKDKSGATVHSYDEPLERMKSQMAIKGAMNAMGVAAVTEREKAAVEAASAAGAQMLDLGLAPDQAVRYSLDVYGKTLRQEFKLSRPDGTGGSGGGGSVMGKEERQRVGALSDDASKIIDQVARDGKMGEVSKAGLHINRGLELLKGDRSGFRDTQAMAQLLREMSGLAVTEQEYNRTVGGEGFKTLVEKALAFYTSTGGLPDETIRELKEVFTRAQASYKRALGAMGSKAYEQVNRRLLLGTPEERAAQADAARGYFTDEYGSPSAPAVPKGKPGGGAAAPAQSDEDLVKAWKAGRK